jgi:hypothetical protein
VVASVLRLRSHRPAHEPDSSAWSTAVVSRSSEWENDPPALCNNEVLAVMRTATAQQQPRGGGGGGGLNANARNFSSNNVQHNRKSSAASSSTSSSTSAGVGHAGAAAVNSNAASSNNARGGNQAQAGPSTTVGGPAASTSNTTQPSSLSLSSAIIGSEVICTLNAGARDKERPVVQGQLWCYDPGYGCIVLKSPSTSADTDGNFRIIRLGSIANVQVVQLANVVNASDANAATTASNDVQLKPIDVNRMQEREAEAVREESKRIANEAPPGVSELGKLLYEALSKTLPVRWANKTMCGVVHFTERLCEHRKVLVLTLILSLLNSASSWTKYWWKLHILQTIHASNRTTQYGRRELSR